MAFRIILQNTTRSLETVAELFGIETCLIKELRQSKRQLFAIIKPNTRLSKEMTHNEEISHAHRC
jgi:hypothetical protein